VIPRARHLYERLAELCEYPSPDLCAMAEDCRAAFAGRHAEANLLLGDFAAKVAALDVCELEELYTRVFDLNPARCLDLGYQIFGETYKRGAFLVKMKEATRAHGVDPGVELHDHLPVTLRLLARLGPDDAPRALVSEVVLPAIAKLLGTFTDDDGGGYRSLLEAIERVLMADFGVDHVDLPRDPEAPRNGAGRSLPMFPGFNPPPERM
jgi:nitrate reductase molybdenum cofactor assembly chaperone NarJ/NarW